MGGWGGVLWWRVLLLLLLLLLLTYCCNGQRACPEGAEKLRCGPAASARKGCGGQLGYRFVCCSLMCGRQCCRLVVWHPMTCAVGCMVALMTCDGSACAGS